MNNRVQSSVATLLVYLYITVLAIRPALARILCEPDFKGTWTLQAQLFHSGFAMVQDNPSGKFYGRHLEFYRDSRW
jgi:hypothetical protein